MNTDILIIGCNISGLIMAYKLSKIKNARVIAVEKENENNIFELADSIPFYINHPIDELELNQIILETLIWYEDQEIDYCNKHISNLYSEKILSRVCNTTLLNYKHLKKIYIPKKNIAGQSYIISELKNRIVDKNVKCYYGMSITEIDQNQNIAFTNTGEIIKYKKCISTVPLNILCKIIKKDIPKNIICLSEPFAMKTIDNTMYEYKVTYCADKHNRFYRIAKLYNKIYIESRQLLNYDALNHSEIKFLEHNGISEYQYKNLAINRIVTPGRIFGNEEDNVKKYEQCFSDRNIYLLGRFSKWRYQLTEDTFREAEEIIKEMKPYGNNIYRCNNH